MFDDLRIIERFCLDRRDISDRLGKSLVVEPGNPFERNIRGSRCPSSSADGLSNAFGRGIYNKEMKVAAECGGYRLAGPVRLFRASGLLE
jgi:hypothetical protein